MHHSGKGSSLLSRCLLVPSQMLPHPAQGLHLHVPGEGETLGFLTCLLLQFVCVESMVTALIDMFPAVFRKKGRRELLILTIAVICYLLGLLLVTEVRKAELGYNKAPEALLDCSGGALRGSRLVFDAVIYP